MPRPADSDSPIPGTAGDAASAPNPIVGRVGLIGALTLVGVMTLDYPSASRLQGWPWSALTTGLWLLPLGVILFAALRIPAWRSPPLLCSVGCALLAASGFASAVFSPYSAASLARLWPTFGGVALYLWLHHVWSSPEISHPGRWQRLGRGLAAAGVLFCVVSLLQWSRGNWPLPWGGRNDFPFGHSTYAAGAVVLFIPWIGQQVWSARGLARGGWMAGIVVALLVLISTSSRGSVLALAFTGGMGIALVTARARWPLGRKVLVVALLFAFGAIAVLTNPRLRDLVQQRQWSEGARESNAQREAMLVAGLRLGAERPCLGWGPGTIPLAYPHVRARLDGGTENALQLHNTPVQVWATTGLAGVLAMALLVAGTVATIFRTSPTPTTVAASASLIGYAIVCLTDHQLDVPAFSILLAVDLALLTASAHLPNHTTILSRLMRIGPAVGVLVPVVVALVATIPDLRARQYYDAALTALGAGRPEEFLQALDRATQSTPGDPYFQHQAAGWLLEQRGTVQEAARQAALTRDAAARLEQSLASGVHAEFAHFNLGWLDLDLNQPDEAIRHFNAAARLVPDKGGVYFGLGLAHLAAGHTGAAVRAFALEAINDPRHITSPAWELPRLALLRPAIRTEVLRLHAQLRHDFPTAATIEAWTRWWWGENVTAAELQPGFNAESALFLHVLAAINTGESLPARDAPWAQTYAAWRVARQPGGAADPGAFLGVAQGDRPLADALARRARRHPDSFQSFLVAPSEDEASLVRLLRHRRQGYGVLALHPEGPSLVDVYVIQENRVATELAAGLLPAKGWLPGRYLLALLPESPR